MATLISSYGSADANSYLLLDEADALIDEGGIVLYKTAWNKVLGDDDTRVTSLIMAANLINGQTWKGRKWFNGQRLAFPRYLPQNDLVGYYGYSPYEYPTPLWFDRVKAEEDMRLQYDRVKNAQALTAIWLLESGGEFPDRDIFYKGRRSLSRGHKFSESLSYAEPPSTIPPLAWDQLRIYRGAPKISRG